MSGKGKRRSARLLKLEEEKNDGDSAGVCLLDPWQIIRNSISGSSARGKRKRNEETQLQGEASCSHHQPLDAAKSNNSTSQSSVGQIIEYILDELELRDRHELFAMPDDIQVTDYAERVSRPGDFATLRQKNKDGMYTALEQFENDVYMVFQRAITMNSQNTVPFREAMSLLDQAKQVFMSLKNNQMFSEMELAAWRQRHQDQLQQPITPEGRAGGNRGPPRHANAAPSPPQPPAATPRKKISAAEAKRQENAGAGAGGSTPESQRARQRGVKESKGTPPVKKARKATTAGVARAGMLARRKLTYNEGAGADQSWQSMARPVFQGRQVILNSQPQEHTYRDSLRGFVRHAGLKARVAAEFRTLECVARARHSPVPQCWNSFLPPPPRPLGAAATAAPEATPVRPPSAADLATAAPECKLETDEVLKLFVLMGTPAAFLDRAEKMFGEGRREESARKEGQATVAVDDTRAGAPTAAETRQKSGAGETSAAAGACRPFAPPKLLPGRLGFGQFAGSSAQPFKLKSKPTTSVSAAAGSSARPLKLKSKPTTSPSTAAGKKKNSLIKRHL